MPRFPRAFMFVQEGIANMSNPVSRPAAPPQPDQEYYGVQELALFKTYTRESYRAAFGVEPPPYDPSRVIKSWFDSTVDASDPGNVAVYKIVGRDQTGNWGLRQMVLPASEAATVNLTGAAAYPPYVVPPTRATRGGSGINANYLSLDTDARALMAEIGGTSVVDEGNSVVFPVVYPPDEPRRAWDIMFQGQPLNVGLLLLMKYAKGVGAPGHWNTQNNDAIWVPAPPPPTGLDDARPPREIPVRDLLPNEKLQTGLMGVGVVRTDLQSSDQFTAADRATLRQIYQIVSKL